jgi:Bacteriophage head to tail connecting protein
MQGLRTDRYSWWVHWRELADYLLPRRYKWLITVNQANRGSPINGRIVDPTATLAARNLASGLMAGVTSPTRPWFRLRIGRTDSDGFDEVGKWLYKVEKIMMRTFQKSNFYNSMGVLYLDIVVFGTACVLIYQDNKDVIRCFNPALGEFFFANNDRMEVDSVYREFVLSISQIMQKWPDCKEETIRALAEEGGASTTREIIVHHAIEPNDNAEKYGIPKAFKWREIYFLRGSTEMVLSTAGFYEFPALTPRWDTVANDAYGRTCAMDALGSVKQLQQEQIRKAQGIDKHVNPPLVADIQLQNQPASSLPGGITYVAGINNVGIKPIYTVAPDLQGIMMDIGQLQESIKSIFFNDLFLMISNLNTVRSATEIDARREEKLIMLGPVLERFENEALSPAIDRVFGILSRGGLLPPAPKQIHGKPIDVQYVSMLAAAQRATETAGLERLFQITGGLAGSVPDILDNIDFDDALDKYASALAVPPTVIREAEAVKKIRDARQKQQQQQQALEATQGSAQAAQTLSKTNVGGGMNALQMMMNGGAGGGGNAPAGGGNG